MCVNRQKVEWCNDSSVGVAGGRTGAARTDTGRQPGFHRSLRDHRSGRGAIDRRGTLDPHHRSDRLGNRPGNRRRRVPRMSPPRSPEPSQRPEFACRGEQQGARITLGHPRQRRKHHARRSRYGDLAHRQRSRRNALGVCEWRPPETREPGRGSLLLTRSPAETSRSYKARVDASSSGDGTNSACCWFLTVKESSLSRHRRQGKRRIPVCPASGLR